MSALSLLDTLVGCTARNEAAEAPASRKTFAVAWARVSTDMQDERGFMSMPEQLREIRQYAERHDLLEALLQPHILLKFTGARFRNVHRENGLECSP